MFVRLAFCEKWQRGGSIFLDRDVRLGVVLGLDFCFCSGLEIEKLLMLAISAAATPPNIIYF